MTRKIVHPKSVHSTIGGGYSHVAIAGDTVYIAGQIARTRDGKLVGVGDAAAQARQVYTNLQAILKELGGSLENIVKMTTYLTDRASLGAYRNARDHFFSDPFPPNTLLFINGLGDPDYLIEVEAIAVL